MSFDQLVGHDLLTEADRHIAAQKERLTAAAAELQAAHAELEAALKVSADADRGVGPLCAFDAEMRAEDATRRHRVAERIHAATQRAVNDAEDARRAAEAVAWRPVYLDGVRRRIAAARAGEAARAALDAADREHAAATAALEAAGAHGTVRVESVHEKVRRLGTKEEELTLWTSNGFNPVEGTYLHWN